MHTGLKKHLNPTQKGLNLAMFKVMDIENWERKEHYYHYSNITQCTYGITIKLEVSNIIKDSLKFYPTMIYYIAKTANGLKEFRISFEDSKLGYYDIINPSYTIFNKDNQNFFVYLYRIQ